MTNIILCSDSFKGTLSSNDIANIGKELINNKYSDKIKLTTLLIADGGEGSLEAFSSILKGEKIFVDTIDAEYEAINVPYFFFDENKYAYNIKYFEKEVSYSNGFKIFYALI